MRELIELSRQGDPKALDELYREVESELRRLARGRLFRMRVRVRSGGLEPSLETTQLLNDAFLRVVGEDRSLANRSHFYAIAAHKMRCLCRDYARHALAAKRGGGLRRVALEDAQCVPLPVALDPDELLALDEALGRLAELDPQQAQVVELRFYGGCGDVEIGEMLGISEGTVRRRWTSARAFLRRELQSGAGAEPARCG